MMNHSRPMRFCNDNPLLSIRKQYLQVRINTVFLTQVTESFGFAARIRKASFEDSGPSHLISRSVSSDGETSRSFMIILKLDFNVKKKSGRSLYFIERDRKGSFFIINFENSSQIYTRVFVAGW